MLRFGWFEMGHLETDVCILIKEKLHLLSKDSNEISFNGEEAESIFTVIPL